MSRSPVRHWAWAVALAVVGVLAGGLVAATSVPAVLSALAVLIAIGTTAYRPALGLAVLTFTYPFDWTTYAGPVKLSTSGLLMVIVGAAILGRFIWSDGWHWHSTQLDLPVLAFAAATFLSTLGMAGYWETQMTGLIKAVGGFTIFFLATQALRARTDVWIVVAAILLAATVQAAAVTLQVVTGSVVVSEETRAMGTVDDPNTFAGFLVLVIPLTLAVGTSFRSWSTTAVTAALMISLSIALIATLSRSGCVGVLAGILVVTVVLPEARWTVLTLTGAVVMSTVFILLTPIAVRVAPHSLESGVSSRMDIWMVAASAGIYHPLFGVGVGNFVNYYPQYGGTIPGINHAHNIFLNTFVERGVLGLLTFVAVLFYLCRSLIRSLRIAGTPLDRAIVAGLMGSLGGYLVHALVEVSYQDYKVLLLFWLLLAVTATMFRLVQEQVGRQCDLGSIPHPPVDLDAPRVAISPRSQ